MSTGPIRFEPVALPTIWGGRRLAERLGRKIPDGRVGECWEISAHPKGITKALTGPQPGHTPEQILGARFPLLVKTLDAGDRLSVQVHPSHDSAARIKGAESKHELWVVLDVTPDAVLWRGFQPGVNRESVEDALGAGTVESLLVEVRPRVGDVIEIPPGTVHAIGPGCLLLEVQESSDTTFRLWDWDRKDEDGNRRELHVENALRCLNYVDTGPPRVRPGRREDGREVLTDGPDLRVERVAVERGARVTLAPGRVHVISNVGEGIVRLEGDSIPLRHADSALMLPEETEAVVAEGEPTHLLLTSAEVSR